MKFAVGPWLLPLALAVIACGAELPAPGAPAAHSGAEGLASPAAASPAPDLRKLGEPTHANDAAWAFPESVDVKGNGPCANVTLGSVLDAIRAGVEEVREIQTFRSLAPNGAMNAGPATPVAEPPPATEKRSYVVGYVDDRSFGAIFFSGQRCGGNSCDDRRYWYYETDDSCRPRWVGHFRTTDRPGGRSGTCVEVTGAPLWRFPGVPAARQRCDADWSPQDISGTRRAFSIDPLGTCSTIKESIVPVTVTIAQAADRANAVVTLHGTGIPFVDGRGFPGQVERQAFNATIDETTTGTCPVRRKFEIRLDFEEGPSINAIPGGFGLVDVTENAAGPCAARPSGCGASLHLIRGE